MSEISLISTQLQQDGINISFRNVGFFEVAFRAPCYVGNHFKASQSIFDAYNCIGNNSKLFNCFTSKYNTFGNQVFTGLGRHALKEISTSVAFYTNELFKSINRINSVQEEHKSLFTRVIVKNDVYIHDNVVFTEDVTVHNGAVILPGSVITKDVPPYAIVSGVNKIQGYRYSDEVISDLLEANWWNYDLPKISNLGYQIPTADPRDLMQFLKDLNPEHKITFPDEWVYFQSKAHGAISDAWDNFIKKVNSDELLHSIFNF